MTPQKIAQFEKYLEMIDARIAAAPDDAALWEQRAVAVAHTDCDLALIVADYERALHIEGHFKRRPGRWAGPLKNQIYTRNCHNWNPRWDESTNPHVRAGGAHVTAYFALYVENAPDLARWRRARPANWNACKTLKRIALTSADASDWKNASVEELKVAAVVAAMTRRDRIAVEFYERALKAEIAAGRHPNCIEYFAHRARNRETADFVQQAWWNLAIEAEPGNPLWHIECGKSLINEQHETAVKSLAHAIALAPNDPYGYEARAKVRDDGKWCNHEDSVSHDYVQAIRLRIAAGQINGAPEYLAARGARLTKGAFLAHAFYSLAIEGNPKIAAWYLARARLLLSLCPAPAPSFQQPAIEPETHLAHADYLRALSLGAALDEVRVPIIEYLVLTSLRPTAHEQIEALLNAHQTLLNAGINATLASEIIAEVERALPRDANETR